MNWPTSAHQQNWQLISPGANDAGEGAGRAGTGRERPLRNSWGTAIHGGHALITCKQDMQAIPGLPRANCAEKRGWQSSSDHTTPGTLHMARDVRGGVQSEMRVLNPFTR